MTKLIRLRASASLFAASLLPLLAVSCLTLAAITTPPAAIAQEPAGFGPLDPTPPKDMTPQQIITKFAARESVFNTARQNYTFRQTVKVDTIDDDTNKVDGQYLQVTDILFDSNGKRDEHVVFAPQNTLERVMMSPSDFQDIEHRLPFVLTTEDLPQYDITYLGRQHIDEIDTYVFDAKPKVLEKGKRYFQGKVWVDQQDFQIVLINGRSVPDDKRKGHEDLSPPYTTYYQQVDGKYWFPTYTKAEGTLHFDAQQGALSEDVHLRTVVKYTDYKQFRATSRIIYNGQDITDNKAPDDNKQQPPPASKP
ncbi:hypothetical protein [Edaphobacter dinghuensis]|uniref:Outer membrane lipoprotein-sorting protein n=1 Tax=Edaphobacter dinghuensis TaxID=1560005 RepID=A0A917H181_9BACT|nr:hypothetical protein [Edaphobacter dinghuensis]GGG64264.1 hypothetical protein GCM10011585_02290 [Edaphobacter dinghuensis]